MIVRQEGSLSVLFFDGSCCGLIGLDWVGLEWIGLDWIGLLCSLKFLGSRMPVVIRRWLRF